MKALLCISHVPDTTSRIKFTNNNTEFDTTDIQYIISPYEELALTRLLQIKEKITDLKTTVVTVGGKDVEPTIRKALAIGAEEAIRVDAEPVDAIFVARQIAEVFKNGDFDFIITGKESIDHNGNQVGEMIAEFLDIPSISSAAYLDIEGDKAIITREIDGGKEVIETPMPFVTSGQKGIAIEPQIASMRGIMMSRRKPLKVIEPVEQEIFTKTTIYELPPPKGQCKMVDPENPQELVRLLNEEAKVI